MGLLDDYEELAATEWSRAEEERAQAARAKPRPPEWAPELIKLLTKHSVPTIALYAEVTTLKPLPPKIYRNYWLRRTSYELINPRAWSIRGYIGHRTGDSGEHHEQTRLTIDSQGQCWQTWYALTPERTRVSRGEADQSLGITITPALRAGLGDIYVYDTGWEANLAAIAAREIVDGTYRIGVSLPKEIGIGQDAGSILVGPTRR